MTARRRSRRLVLALCLLAITAIGHPTTAAAAPITVGDLSFTVPDTIQGVPTPSAGPGPPGQVSLGEGWQWAGQASGAAALPSTVVLARADLAATDAGEVLGLVLAGSAAGMLPDLKLTNRRVRPMPGGEQTRVGLQYSAGPGVTYHGEILIAIRPQPPASLLVVLGDDELTAATVDSILESARWRS
jgi:hypothetical protein